MVWGPKARGIPGAHAWARHQSLFKLRQRHRGTGPSALPLRSTKHKRLWPLTTAEHALCGRSASSGHKSPICTLPDALRPGRQSDMQNRIYRLRVPSARTPAWRSRGLRPIGRAGRYGTILKPSWRTLMASDIMVVGKTCFILGHSIRGAVDCGKRGAVAKLSGPRRSDSGASCER